MRVTIKYTIFDFDIDPDIITKTLAIEPSITKIKGHINIRAGREIIAKENMWIIKRVVDKQEEFEDVLMTLLLPVSKRSNELSRVLPKCSSELAIIIDGEEPNPGIHVNTECLRLLATIGSELDIDIYALG